MTGEGYGGGKGETKTKGASPKRTLLLAGEEVQAAPTIFALSEEGTASVPDPDSGGRFRFK